MVHAALAGSLAIALIKFAAASWTGSSAMLSEGVHSLVDTINACLLMYGIARGRRHADASHPLGYGRELYFWSFIVSLMVLALGAGVSLYEGITHLLVPAAIKPSSINAVVLGLSLACEVASGWYGFKTFKAGKGQLGYFGALRASKDPALFIVVFGDAAAMLGLLIAALGILFSGWLQRPEPDAWASIGIGLVLAVAAVLFTYETKELLIGEAALPEVREAILRITEADPDVRHANAVLTVQMGPSQVIAAMSVAFMDRLDTRGIEACVIRLERAIKAAHPDVRAIFVRPQTSVAWLQQSVPAGDRPAPAVVRMPPAPPSSGNSK